MKTPLKNTRSRLARSGKESMSELIRVYQDLERTLKNLRQLAPNGPQAAVRQVNLPRLIDQLSQSKRRIERKIRNTLLLEKEGLKRNLRHMMR